MDAIRALWQRARAWPTWVQAVAAAAVIILVVGVISSGGDNADSPNEPTAAPVGQVAASANPNRESAETVAQPAVPAVTETPADALPEPALDEATEAAQDGPTAVAAEVIRVDDVSFGDVVRLVVRAVVPYPMTETEARAVLDRLIAEAAAEPLNAVAVTLYDDILFVDGPFTVAQAEFAPGGVWGEAGTVAAGDYASHETVYQFRPKLADPEAAAADRPSPAEREACAAFAAARVGLDDFDATDDDVALAASLETGIPADEIQDATLRCATWPHR